MNNFINMSIKEDKEVGDKLTKKVLIATLYKAEPVILATTRLGPQKLILLIDNEPDKEQQSSIKLIQDSLGKVIEVKVIKTDVYDILKIAKDCVKIIDDQEIDDIIYVNITAGRKTKALGLLYAAYARHDRVKKIAYNPEEDKNSVIYLPRLSFKFTKSQDKILEAIEKDEFKTISALEDKLDMSTAMIYRAIDDLKDMDLITTEQGIKLTDAGKIARL